MKTKIYFLPIMLLFALVLSACGSKNQESNNSNFIDNDKVVIDSNDENFSENYEASLEEMFSKGKSLKCLVSDESPETKMDITYYIDGKNKRFRAETKIIDNSLGDVINSVSILKDDYSYFWDDLNNKDGIKMKMEDDEMDDEVYDNDFGLEDDSEGLDLDEKFNLKCSSWKVNEKMFNLPKDKSFKDMSDLSNSFNNVSDIDMNIGDNGEIDYCSFCNLIPEGEERNECLSSCDQ